MDEGRLILFQISDVNPGSFYTNSQVDVLKKLAPQISGVSSLASALNLTNGWKVSLLGLNLNFDSKK